MNILYVAKHNSGGNDEEGAIDHALSTLGHKVKRVHEKKARLIPSNEKADLMLFHKWYDVNALARLSIPKVFWYFDLVESPNDPTLESRDAARVAWMRVVVPFVSLGFCTDGDWVAKDKTKKLVWLPQGFDSRQEAIQSPKKTVDILFTGGKKGGVLRQSFVEELESRYGDRFRHVTRGVHGPALAREIASAKVVVAPDYPVSDRYWSNRVYLTLGYRGLILHRRSSGLRDQMDGLVPMYGDREELHERISHYLNLNDSQRQDVADVGHDVVMEGHTYIHRCRQLLSVVKERLKII